VTQASVPVQQARGRCAWSYVESPGTRRFGSAKAAKIQSLLDRALAIK